MRRHRSLAVALTCALALVGCADEPKAATPSGISTATPAATATAAATPVALTPQRLRTMTVAELEPVLSKSLVLRTDLPPAPWALTEVPLRDATSALTMAATGDRTRLLPIFGAGCIVSFPTGDSAAVGVMRVFSIATAAQGTTLVSGVFRTSVDAQAVIDRGQAAVDTPEVARCLSEALASAMATQLPGGTIDILDNGGAEGLPPGVGSAQFVARVSGGDSVFTVSMVSIAIAAGPVISVTAEVAIVPRDEVPFLPGRPLDLLAASGTRLGEALGIP